MKRFFTMIVTAVLLAGICLAGAQPAYAAEELYDRDFGDAPYEGMNHLVGPGGQPFVVDQAYGKDIILEAVIQVHSILDESGRGVKFILREHLLADSGDLEVWIGLNHIWACTTEWKNHSEFDFSPYLGRDVTVRIVICGNTVVVFIDGMPVWSHSDTSFALSVETPVELSGWDAAYTIKSVKIFRATEEDLKTDIAYTDYEFPVPEMGGTTYYVDADAAPGGDGLSPETAWKTIAQVNEHGDFLPDDQLLFKRGCVWEGETLRPKGSGVKGHPIILGSYGEGDKPIIDRKSLFNPKNGENGSYAVWFQNQQYWTIRDIEIRNNSATTPGKPEEPYRDGALLTLPMRGGIIFTGSTTPYVNKTLRGIILENVTVAQVDCIGADECLRLMEIYEGVDTVAGGAGGIAIRGSGSPLDNKGRVLWDDVQIVGCEFKNVGGTPISVEGGWEYTDTVKNLVIRNNYIYTTEDHQMTGHGIYIVNAKEPLVEYNRIENTANGIAMQVCNGGTMQYNVVTGTDGYMHYASELAGEPKHSDGCAFDVETDSEGIFILQNNFSANCYSDAYVAFDYYNRGNSPSARNAHVIIRNNISVNDKLFFHYPAANKLYTFEVTNNTVLRTENARYIDHYEVIEVEPRAGDGAVLFKHNIFSYAGTRVTFSTGDYSVFEDNIYCGDIFQFFRDEAAINADPKFISIPTAEDLETWNYSYCGSIPGTEDLSKSGYFNLYGNSPAIVDGKQIYGADLNDFFRGVTAFGMEAPSFAPLDVSNPEPTQPAGNNRDWIYAVGAIVAAAAAASIVLVVIIRKKQKA